MTDRCETCRFVQRLEYAEMRGKHHVGGTVEWRCRRWPPTTPSIHKWPVVNEYDWCGEYQPKGGGSE